jgi:hypothetical protein
MRLCRECRWTRKPSDHNRTVCDHPSSHLTDTAEDGTRRLRSEGHQQRYTCREARLPPWPGEDGCGPEGKHWRPRVVVSIYAARAARSQAEFAGNDTGQPALARPQTA